MRKRSRVLVWLLSAAMVCGLVGCGGSTSGETGAASSDSQEASNEDAEDSADSAEKKDGYKIAIVPNSLNDPYMIILSNAAKKQCDELGIEGVVQSTSSGSLTDVAGQTELIENIIANGTYDGLVVAAMSMDGINVSVKACQDAGLPIVMMDNNADQDALEADGYERIPFVGTDNYNAALATGKWIKENYPEGTKLAKVNGEEGNDNGNKRKQGIDDGLEGWCDVVAEQSTDWSVDEGYIATQNILTANPDVEVVWAACDAIGVGCVRALEEAGLLDKVDVIGFDGTVDGLELVKSGDEIANTAQSPDVAGREAINVLLQVIEGETPEMVTDSGFEIITKDKAEERIEKLKEYL